LFSNNNPACSKARFLLVAAAPRTTFDGGNSRLIKFI
jgi:hypothetical protein